MIINLAMTFGYNYEHNKRRSYDQTVGAYDGMGHHSDGHNATRCDGNKHYSYGQKRKTEHYGFSSF